jgi:hypothetical protein
MMGQVAILIVFTLRQGRLRGSLVHVIGDASRRQCPIVPTRPPDERGVHNGTDTSAARA